MFWHVSSDSAQSDEVEYDDRMFVVVETGKTKKLDANIKLLNK